MLAYREYGNQSGVSVFYIHGGFTNSESFQKQYDLLPECHCFFVDLPGYGKSPACGSFDFAKAAEEMVELIDAKTPGQSVVLIAHSYGGLVAKQLLLKIPDRIKKVIIGSTNIKNTPLFWFYTGWPGCLYLYFLEKKRYSREYITYKLVRETQRSAWKNFELPKNTTCEIPALLLYAEYDIRTIRQSMESWKSFLVNAKVCRVENCGHNYFWDSPQQTNRLIRDFI